MVQSRKSTEGGVGRWLLVPLQAPGSTMNTGTDLVHRSLQATVVRVTQLWSGFSCLMSGLNCPRKSIYHIGWWCISLSWNNKRNISNGAEFSFYVIWFQENFQQEYLCKQKKNKGFRLNSHFFSFQPIGHSRFWHTSRIFIFVSDM